jgi:hypothetical protein
MAHHLTIHERQQETHYGYVRHGAPSLLPVGADGGRADTQQLLKMIRLPPLLIFAL